MVAPAGSTWRHAEAAGAAVQTSSALWCSRWCSTAQAASWQQGGRRVTTEANVNFGGDLHASTAPGPAWLSGAAGKVGRRHCDSINGANHGVDVQCPGEAQEVRDLGFPVCWGFGGQDFIEECFPEKELGALLSSFIGASIHPSCLDLGAAVVQARALFTLSVACQHWQTPEASWKVEGDDSNTAWHP